MPGLGPKTAEPWVAPLTAATRWDRLRLRRPTRRPDLTANTGYVGQVGEWLSVHTNHPFDIWRVDRALRPFGSLALPLHWLESRREMPEERRRFDDLKASEILLSVVNLQNSLD